MYVMLKISYKIHQFDREITRIQQIQITHTYRVLGLDWKKGCEILVTHLGDSLAKNFLTFAAEFPAVSLHYHLHGSLPLLLPTPSQIRPRIQRNL